MFVCICFGACRVRCWTNEVGSKHVLSTSGLLYPHDKIMKRGTTSADLLGERGSEDSQPLQCFTYDHVMEPRADEMCRVQTDLNLCDDCKDGCKDGAKMIAKIARQRASQPSNPCVGRAPEDTQRHTTTTTSADLLGEGGCEDSQPLQCFMCDRVMEPRADDRAEFKQI